MASKETLEQKTFYPDYRPASEARLGKKSRMLSYTGVSLLVSIATAAVIVGTYYTHSKMFPKDIPVVASYSAPESAKPATIESGTTDPAYFEPQVSASRPPIEEVKIIPNDAELPETNAYADPTPLEEVAVLPAKVTPPPEVASSPAPSLEEVAVTPEKTASVTENASPPTPSLEEVAVLPAKVTPPPEVSSSPAPSLEEVIPEQNTPTPLLAKGIVDADIVEMNTLADSSDSYRPEIYHKSPNPYLKKKSPDRYAKDDFNYPPVSQEFYNPQVSGPDKPVADQYTGTFKSMDSDMSAAEQIQALLDASDPVSDNTPVNDGWIGSDGAGTWGSGQEEPQEKSPDGWYGGGGNLYRWGREEEPDLGLQGGTWEVLGDTPTMSGRNKTKADSMVRDGWIDQQQRHAIQSQDSLSNNPTGLQFGGQDGLPPGVLYHILQQQQQQHQPWKR